jgi:hypothetical protein
MAGQDEKAGPTTRLSGRPSSLVARVRSAVQSAPGHANARGLSVGSSTIIPLMPTVTRSESMDRGTCSSIAGHGTPDPHPHPRFAGDRGWGSQPRFAGDRGSTPTPTPDLPESGIQLSTIEYAKGCIVLAPVLNLKVNCHSVQPIKLF